MRPRMDFRLLLRRRHRSRRAGVARRLCQHVIVSDDHLAVAALGIALLTLEANLIPVWRGDFFERLARRLIHCELANVLGMSLGCRGLPWLGLLGGRYARANAREEDPAQKETDGNAEASSHAKRDASQSDWFVILT